MGAWCLPLWEYNDYKSSSCWIPGLPHWRNPEKSPSSVKRVMIATSLNVVSLSRWACVEHLAPCLDLRTCSMSISCKCGYEKIFLRRWFQSGCLWHVFRKGYIERSETSVIWPLQWRDTKRIASALHVAVTGTGVERDVLGMDINNEMKWPGYPAHSCPP